MGSQRQIKFGKQIQRDLAEIFQKDRIHYFNNKLGTITQVDITPDLSLAKVHISIFPMSDAKDTLLQLEDKKKEIRLKLGKKIRKKINRIPDLIFLHDDTDEKASKIDSVLSKLNIPPASE